ncbi:MAG TPA: hypothetical protein VGS97_07160 [Actinocrinis sp.]|uniref:hypothetical protein n=1 Tax=Actinocrinis sp. TaxID=1920516 RepID=UPI002DDD0906|nr:hypothetical protein [Actinocrinis sp.]HEV2343853.1 hypothetical protein [Actinocrinis sp.]
MAAFVIILAAVVVVLAAQVAWFVKHPRVVEVPVSVPISVPVAAPKQPAAPLPGPSAPTQPQPSVRVVTKYLREPEPEIPAHGSEHLTEPQALPDPPLGLPDSTVDGVRLGTLSVRAAAVRGEVGRRDGRLRRQVAEIAILDTFNPPVLLSAVAAGRPTARYSQLGAVHAIRAVYNRLTDRSALIDQAWRETVDGDEDGESAAFLAGQLRAVTAALTEPLAEAARRRDQPPEAVATQLTCLLSRIGDTVGDTRRRAHLAFGVGGGPVLSIRSGSGWSAIERGGTGQPAGHRYLPFDHADTWLRHFATDPGDLLVVCSATSDGPIRRRSDRLSRDWAQAPSFAGFLHQVGLPDDVSRDDRAVVCLWEAAPRDE